MSALPLADVAALRPAARRTALVRGGLAAALLLALALAYVLAPGGDRRTAFAAGGSGAVVVLDVSGSVADEQQSRLVRRLLAEEQDAAGPSGRVGLVLFSDTAIETLPPTAPAAQLATFRRFFVPLPKQARTRRTWLPGALPSTTRFPHSPWELFVGGTAISTGLREARLALARAGMGGGRVLLVSDLVDSPDDLGRLRREVARYARDPGLDLQVRALPSDLAPSLAPFRTKLGPGAVQRARVPLALPASSTHRAVSVWLVAAAAAAAAALALHELLAVPLRWGEVAA